VSEHVELDHVHVLFGGIVARCSCGWQSRETNDAAVAHALFGEHLRYLDEGPQVVR